MSEEFEGFDDIFESADQAVSQKRLEANVLSNEELKDIYVLFREHHKAEMLKNWKDRSLYIDEYGATWVACKTPDEFYENNGTMVENKVGKVTEVAEVNGKPKTVVKSYYMFGYNAILLGKYTNFMYFGTNKQSSLIGFTFNAVVRGHMTTKYYFPTEDYKKARWDNQLVRDYNSINSTEHKTLSEVPRSAYKINLTFNYWQTVSSKPIKKGV